MSHHNITRVTGTTVEQQIAVGPCRVIAIIPEGTTAGTVTLGDEAAVADSNVFHIAAIGLTQAGKKFSESGARLQAGLTAKLSNSGDAVAIIWAPTHNG